jgi:hypothetical protein
MFQAKALCREVCCGGLENYMSFYDHVTNIKSDGFNQNKVLGHSRKHPYHPHGGNRKLTPLPPSDVLIHLLLSETIFSPLPLQTAEIPSVRGVWIFSGTTHYKINKKCKSHYGIY